MVTQPIFTGRSTSDAVEYRNEPIFRAITAAHQIDDWQFNDLNDCIGHMHSVPHMATKSVVQGNHSSFYSLYLQFFLQSDSEREEKSALSSGSIV